MKVKLTTDKEILERANAVDYGLRHQELPWFSFKAKITEKLKEFRLIWRF